MIAKTKIAMLKIAGHGADKIEKPDSGYQVYPVDTPGHFKVVNPNGRHYLVVLKPSGASFCRCEFHAENRIVYGNDTECKHSVVCKRYVADMDAYEAFAEEREENEAIRAMYQEIVQNGGGMGMGWFLEVPGQVEAADRIEAFAV